MSGTCEFSGCTKPVWVGEGVVHNYCGRTHACAALNRKRLQLQPRMASAIAASCLAATGWCISSQKQAACMIFAAARMQSRQNKQELLLGAWRRRCQSREKAVEAKAQGIVPNGGSTSPVHWKDNGAAAEKEVEAEPETST
eukprot:CAMPEP_0177748748 /NCGR_PEP_ID=MMETSP0484_2-20121128/32104_1 /TAXON_ID=354590 /ORGANISM="Rhodomonas lens, Strain RHODO" /LENGTH=140 /DNA_ID=CAMNT_0019263657 /DNA_START=12 /DNA_END=431 /DNA_ORIENTATION=+